MVAPVINMPNTIKAFPESGRPTQLFVQHSAECPLAAGYARSLTNWANTSNVEASWHSFVGPDERVRMVPWNLGAWTQAPANGYGIGMEVAGYAAYTKAQWLTDAGRVQLENLAHEWVYYWRIEKSLGNEIPLRWLSANEVQAVINGNRTIKGFCTHGQVAPASRWDPGPNFPYVELMARIKALIAPAPPVPPKPPATTPKEPFTVAQYDTIIANQKKILKNQQDIKSILTRSYSMDGKTVLAGVAPIVTVNQRENRRNGHAIAALDAKVATLAQAVAADHDLTAAELTAIMDAALQKHLGARAAQEEEEPQLPQTAARLITFDDDQEDQA